MFRAQDEKDDNEDNEDFDNDWDDEEWEGQSPQLNPNRF